jgi:hypothetical protein
MTGDQIILAIVYLFMGIWSGHIGRILHHSKSLRLLEILFWPICAVAIVLWGMYISVTTIFHDEEIK